MVRWIILLIWLSFPAVAEGNLRLSIETAPRDFPPVVGEMVEVTIRAVYDRKIANEKLEIVAGDGFDWVQTRADDWREERIDGLPYIVMERHLALWPKRAGPVQFGPVRHHLTVIDRQSQRQDVVVEARPLMLSVGEFPALKGWHFTARKLELVEELSTDPARLGDDETVIRRITLRALGALPEHLPPRPIVSENWLITFAAPVERELILTDEGPVAQVVWTWQLRPHTGEPGVLEGVPIPYFNTATHALDRVEIPALPISLASFFTGQVPVGRVSTAQALGLLALGFSGVVMGLALAARRFGRDAAWRGQLTRFSPRLWLAYRRARGSGDLLAARRLAEVLRRPEAEIRALDRALYAPPGG